jgi:hypothetical protein
VFSLLVGAPTCTGKPRLAASPTEPAIGTPAPESCAAARRGPAPAWAEDAGPRGLPFVISRDGDAVGFLFADPLRAGHPTNPVNKILWVVRFPRVGRPLQLTAHPVAASRPVMSYSEPADSGPGEIYPSIIDVPTPGCWHFGLVWAGHSDEVELPYVSPATS